MANAFSSACNCITVHNTFALAHAAYNKQICKEPLNHDKFSLIRDPTNCSDNYRRAIPRLITSAPALWSAATITSARRSPRHCFPAPLSGFQFPSINISSTKALAWDSSRHCPLKIVSYSRPCPRNSSHPAGIWRTSLLRKISLGFRSPDRHRPRPFSSSPCILLLLTFKYNMTIVRSFMHGMVLLNGFAVIRAICWMSY